MTTDVEVSRPAEPVHVDLATLARGARGNGVQWSLAEPSDLNVNLVRLEPDAAIAEHTNDELDVLIVVLEGGGSIEIDGCALELALQALVHVPAGAPRSIRAGSDGVHYLTVHRRRGGIEISRPG